MLETVIDFQQYSSIKIGTAIPVKIIEFCDLGFSLASLISDNKGDLLSSSYINETLKPSLLFKNSSLRPRILENYTLTSARVLESKTHSTVLLGNQNLRIIGRANNLLVSPHAKNLAVLGEEFNYISLTPDYIEMGASVSSIQAFLYFKKNNFAGLEFLKNLPGNIGALCNMNAGMKHYEIAQSLIALNINGEWIDVKDALLHYRGRASLGVIFAVRFHKKVGFRHELLEIFKNMRQTHPKNPSCGSCFKNPENNYAGKLLEEAGLKGFIKNDVGFSALHANFLVNLGRAQFEDAISVISYAQTKVYEQTGIMLECEVKICN